MISFLYFLSLALAGTALASPLKFGMVNNLARRDANVECSDSGETAFLTASYAESNTLAKIALDYIQEHGITDPVFTAYFGSGLENSTLQTDIFSTLTGDKAVNLSCSDPHFSCTQNIDISQFGTYSVDNTLYFCPSFYNQPSITTLCSGTSVDSGLIRGGTMLHEVSRALYGTGYLTGSCSDARTLASISTERYEAGQNADNYSCFAMQVYANTQC